MSRITATLWAEDGKQMQFPGSVGQTAVIGGCGYSGLLIYSIGYTWQHLTCWQHRGMFCRRFWRGRKAHGNLSPGAAGAELCWQKEPGITGKVRNSVQHCCTSSTETLLPPRAAPELQQKHLLLATALRQARGLLLLSTIDFKCSPATQAQLSPSLTCPLLSLLSLVFSPTLTWSTTRPQRWHIVWCHGVTPFPPHPYSFVFFIQVQPSVQQSPENTSPREKPQRAPAIWCRTEIFLWKEQKYSSETSALTSGSGILCTPAKKQVQEIQLKLRKKQNPRANRHFLVFWPK